ncbi:MAG: aminopeptidase [Flavobacteriales bacterium]|nr:MAG: aminopeptidase [Flavobacteriales bacterium]
MRKALIFLLFQLFSFILFSQDIDFARKIIDTLTSAYFSGRGAVDEGEKKAAYFIAKQYKYLELKKFNDSYFQEFKSPINTFSGELNVRFNNAKLTAGVDYLVNAQSIGIKGTFPLVWYNVDNVPSKKQLKKLANHNFFINKFIVIDTKGAYEDSELFLLQLNLYGATGVVLIEDNKLTHHLSNIYNDYAFIIVKREAINRSFKTLTIEINQKRVRDYQSQNVIGYVEGTEHPDSFIVLSAHYDHLGMMGNEVYFPGANDNASGVAMLLNLAYHYTHKEPPTKTIIFIAFGAEEVGLIGSKYFVNHPTIELNKINFVFNMDLMGTGSKGAMIVNGAIYEKQYAILIAINKKGNYLSSIKKRGKAANSDHYWFSENNVPAFFMYLMGGIKAYHDIDDISKTLPLTKFEDSFRLIRDFVDEL